MNVNRADTIQRRQAQLTEVAEANGWVVNPAGSSDSRSWNALVPGRGAALSEDAVFVEFSSAGAITYAALGNRRATGQGKFEQVLAYLKAREAAS